jgi:hypothetical protein
MKAYRTIKSLKDTLLQVETNVSLIMEQNNYVLNTRTNLENDLRNMIQEVKSHTSDL